MTKIEELIFKNDLEFIDPRRDVEIAMKEYAEWYVTQVLDELDKKCIFSEKYNSWFLTNKPSTIGLPAHE